MTLVPYQQLLQLIPQRPPMVMIDTLVATNATQTTSSFHIKSSNVFIQDKVLTEAGIIENIAQTAAARIGYICHQEKKEVPLGYIGAIKKLKIHQLPKVNSTLTTTISIVREIFNVTLVAATVADEHGQLIGACEMKVFLNSP